MIASLVPGVSSSQQEQREIPTIAHAVAVVTPEITGKSCRIRTWCLSRVRHISHGKRGARTTWRMIISPCVDDLRIRPDNLMPEV